MGSRHAYFGLVIVGIVLVVGCETSDGADDQHASVEAPAESLESTSPEDEEESSGDGDFDEAPAGSESTLSDDCSRGYWTLLPHGIEGASTQTCCLDAECWTHIGFSPRNDEVAIDEERSLQVDGWRLRQQDIAPGRESVMVGRRASAAESENLFSVDVEALVEWAGPVEESKAVVDRRELVEAANWRLPADAVHRFEGLSARALDEAKKACREGVHVPTMIRLADEVEPRSEHLDLVFERWLTETEVLLSTYGDEGRWTSIEFDTESECMERRSHEPWPEVSVDVDTADGLIWESTEARRASTAGDDRAIVVRGVVTGPTEAAPLPEAPTPKFHLAPAVEIDGDRVDDEKVVVVGRDVGDAELIRWLESGGGVDELVVYELSDPVSKLEAEDRWRRRVTIVVDVDEVGRVSIDLEAGNYPK